MHRIDPRIVIIQIVLSGICAFWIFKPLAMLCEVIFLMSFLLYLQHPKEALRLGVWFAFLVGLYALLNESNAPQIIVQPVFLLRKLSPLLGVMILSLKALTVSELFMGLQKLHCPKSATLALAVALRFIPTIRHELEQIRNGMKTRGVPLNVITFVKAPAMTTEYMIIPFIMRCIPQGGMTAIVGPSGGGKTTITRLISRFWDIQGGSITIGGKDVREFTSDSLLKNMSMVFQNVYLFKDTIENNIKFGCPEASHEQVVEAAKKARCHDFISLLPEGYNTMIGEGGSTLSGGEKQRISIARAMLKNAPVVLLDEATASVDPENEVYLQQAISTLVKDKTLIVIAHRLSTIRDAEQILVIDNGKLVQHGKHDELVLQEGIYQKYWNIRQNAKAWKVAQ